MANKKYTLTMDDALMARVEEYAERLHIGRYAAISVLVSQALDGQQALTTLGDFVQLYKAESAQKIGSGADADKGEE